MRTSEGNAVVDGAKGEEDVDCVTAKEQVKACDAQCLPNMETTVKSKGYEVTCYRPIVGSGFIPKLCYL